MSTFCIAKVVTNEGKIKYKTGNPGTNYFNNSNFEIVRIIEIITYKVENDKIEKILIENVNIINPEVKLNSILSNDEFVKSDNKRKELLSKKINNIPQELSSNDLYNLFYKDELKQYDSKMNYEEEQKRLNRVIQQKINKYNEQYQ